MSIPAISEEERDVGFSGDSLVKNLPSVQDTQVRSLGWEDPVKVEKATHPSILAWKTPWTEEPEGLQPKDSQRGGRDLTTQQQQQQQRDVDTKVSQPKGLGQPP